CGENGAGKTSILEAIAWVLFNYQGDYAKEDLIRNGSGSAQVTVAFTSNYDSRTYRVQRCTQRGYVLFDPQLNERLPYTRIKDEVLPWLRQHLGVSAGTNLPQLFARTLGVPQGTFTVDFLQPAEQRKTVFDAILKVEDYKLAFKQMNALRRYAEDQVETTKVQIAQYNESLTTWDDLHQRQQMLVQAIATSETRLQEIDASLAQLTLQRDTFRAQAQQVQTLTNEKQGLSHQLEGRQAAMAQLQRSVQQAEQAIGLCQTHRADYDHYQATEQALQALGQQQRQRQRWQADLQALQVTQGQKQVELARWQTQLESFVAIERDLAHLQSHISTQEQLESKRQILQQQMEQYQRCRVEQQQSRAQLEQLAQQLAEALKSRDRLIALRPKVEEIPAFEDQRNRIQQQLSRIAAVRQFEAELSTLVTMSRQQGQAQQAEVKAMLEELATQASSLPLLSNPLLERLGQALRSTSALHDSLVSDLEAILRDLTHQTDTAGLKTALKTVEDDLKQRYGWRAEIDRLDEVMTQIQQIQQTQAALATQLDDLAQQIATQTTTETDIAAIDQELEALGRPREKSQILQRTLQDKSRVEQAHVTQTAELGDLNRQIEALSTQLRQYADLDQQLDQLHRDRTVHQTGYNLYLQNQQLANQHSPLQAELATATAELARLQERQQTLEQALQTVLASFDPAAAADLDHTYNATKSEADQLTGSLPQQRQRLSDINQQITGLEAITKRRDEAQQQLRTKEKAKRFINFARKAYNEAGPRITEQYVRSISHQADRLFRELLNRPNVALQWTRDYEILVQEGPNQRRFVNLSGGEQMCAALAVRLALLKVLADVDIAFF
ncbi:MAG: SMC family ATPase, partial [Cyanobacteria bacterium J06638_6]